MNGPSWGDTPTGEPVVSASALVVLLYGAYTLVAGLFPINSGYDFQILYRRKG